MTCCKTRFFMAAMLALALAACSDPDTPQTYTGYVEAEYVYVAAPAPGWLVNLDLREGDSVAVGDVLFTLDQDLQVAAVAEAKSRLAQAAAQAQDLETGARDEELRVLEAELREARATLKLATAERIRWTELTEQGVAPVTRRDQVIADAEKAQARVQTLQRNMEVARLAGRDSTRDAALAGRNAAAAAVEQADWHLEQRQVIARTTGRVEDVFHRAGEFVTAGTPVLALLPPDALKVRFFVPQSALSAVAVGGAVEVMAEASPAPVQARVSFVAKEAEFTPPVIYSVGSREKLVFLVEARLDNGTRLHPGQPIDVRVPTAPPS